MEMTFLQDLAIVMAVSAAIMILCRRIGLPVVLGYILAGVIIGPHTPPYPLIKDLHSIHTLSELGVILLLFAIGLEFSLTKLGKVGLVSFVAATLEILLMIWIGYSLGTLFGWGFMNSLFLGAILSISSTTIIAKVLIDMNKVQERFAQVILGILIIEDLLAIIIIAFLSGLATTGSLEINAIAVATVKVVIFMAAILFLGFLFVPRLLRYLARYDNSEMMVITVLGLCFGAALLAAEFGFSVALGSFLMGAIIAETPQAKNIIHKIEPIRDMFTAIFFVSVGMLIDPRVLADLWIPILIITLITIAGKIFSCTFATFIAGYPPETSLKVGLGLAQIGEFSFIIARLGNSTDVTSPFLYPIAVSVSVITTLTTPFLMKNTQSIIRFLAWIIPKPAATVLNLYTSWVETIGGIRAEKKNLIWNQLKTQIPWLFLYVSLAAGAFYGASYFEKYDKTLPLNVHWIMLGVIMYPIFMGFVYSLDRILWDVLFMNLIKSRRELDRTEDVSRTMHNAFRFLLVLGIGLVFIAIGSVFMPRMPLAIAVSGLVILSGFFAWGSVRRLHEKIEKTALQVFSQPESPQEKSTLSIARDELTQLIRKEYPWDVETEDFLLPYEESAVNQTLLNLRLRSVTGASIVAIYRADTFIPNPSPDTKLLPGDVLLLMGSKEQLQSAVRFFNQKIKESPAKEPPRDIPPKTQPFTIPAGSAWTGKTLRDLRLRRQTGVNVLGIQKPSITLNNPDPETLLEEGDTLILFGWPDQIEAAVKHLSATPN